MPSARSQFKAFQMYHIFTVKLSNSAAIKFCFLDDWQEGTINIAKQMRAGNMCTLWCVAGRVQCVHTE